MVHPEIPAEAAEQYRQEGYFVLPGFLCDRDVRILREECDRQIAAVDAEMDRAGTDTVGLNHRNSRYFIAKRWRESAVLRRFLFSPPMARICRAALGGRAYLFWEQFVVKCAETGLHFGWHQDSGYVGHDHQPYVSAWCALDPVDEENGAVYLLPFSRAGTRRRVDHQREAGTNDLIGYRGPDPGVPVTGPAGTVAVFSSVTFHRSGPNRSSQPRRVYLAQYSAEPILKADGSGPWGFAEPFLPVASECFAAGASHGETDSP